MSDYKKKPIPEKSTRSKPDFQKERRMPPKEEWVPITDLGRLVKERKVGLDDIFKYSLRINEPEIVDFLFGNKLKEEVLCIHSVQKQTKAGQRTRMKAVVVVGDNNGYVGIGTKAAREVASAIKGAILRAKCALRPVRLGYWGSAYGDVHTVPCKAAGKAGSVMMRVIPAPKGTGIRAGSIPRKIFQLAGVKDVFTVSTGQTATTENFAKATIEALDNASTFFMPELWEKKEVKKNPLLEHSGLLKELQERCVLK